MSAPPLVHVLLPTGARVAYEVTKSTTVADLADLLRCDPAVAKPPNRTICLIYHGRVLAGPEAVAQLDTLEEFTLHACFRVGAHAAGDAGAELRGFERLARMGYAPEQIADVRRDFHATHGSARAPPDEQIEIEEEWLPVIFNGENPLQALRPPRAEEPLAPRADADAGPDADAGTDPEDALVRSPWLKFAFGLVVGAIFGIGSVIFVVVSSQDGAFLLGLVLGICARFFMQYELDLS
jgi:hypothetical protein